MIISFDNSWGSIDSQFPYCHEIENYCSYLIPNARFVNVVKMGYWNGRKALTLRKDNLLYFPVGCLHDIIEIFKRYQVPFKLKDLRIKPESTLNYPSKFNGEIREYQVDAVNMLIKSSRGIVHIGTRGGKNAVISQALQRLNMPAVIVSPTKDICYQIKKDITEYTGIVPGIFGNSKKENNPIVICTIQSLSSGLKLKDFYTLELLNRPILFIDESHRLGANSYYECVMRSKAYYKIGFTGTPFRNDTKGLLLQASTGRIIYSKSSSDLIENNFINQAEVRMCLINRQDVPNWVPFYSGDYHKMYDSCIVFNEDRNRLIARIAEKEIIRGHKVLIFVSRIDHGKQLKKLITKSEFIEGKLETEERIGARDLLSEGKLKCLITTVISDEGVTMPEVNVGIMASGGKSKVKIIQRMGRLLCKSEVEGTSIMYDFFDNWNGLFRTHSIERSKAYKLEKNFVFKGVESDTI